MLDMNGIIQGYTQNFNALGDLGRFMLNKRAQDSAQAQTERANRLQDEELRRRREREEQIRQMMLGAQTRTQETQYTEELPAEYAEAPDIGAYMQGMGKPVVDTRSMGGHQDATPWRGSFLNGQADRRSLAETMTGQKDAAPKRMDWSLPLAPVEVLAKRSVTRTRTEQAPNENWLGDAAKSVATVDPELGMDMARAAAVTEGRGSSVYTPEQKQLVDAKQQNRISLDRAAASLNAAMQRGDDGQIGYWDAQVKVLKENDLRMNDQLAGMGVAGYAMAQPAASGQGGGAGAGQAEGTVDLDKDVARRREFMGAYAPKRLADVPTESDIMADAMEKGYRISRSGAAQIKGELQGKVQNAYSDKETAQKLTDTKRRAAQEQYDNWLRNTLPSVDKAYNGLLETRNGIASALEQANRSAAGGAYIAMKKVLGDALSNADFAGIAGFGVDTGLIGLLKAKLGATAMNDADAKAIMREAVNGFNTMLKSYEGRFDDPKNPQYVAQAKKAYGLKPLDGGNSGAPTAGGAKPRRKAVPIDDSADF